MSHPSLGMGHPSIVPTTSLSHSGLMSHSASLSLNSGSAAAAQAQTLHLSQAQSLNMVAPNGGQPIAAHSHPANLSAAADRERPGHPAYFNNISRSGGLIPQPSVVAPPRNSSAAQVMSQRQEMLKTLPNVINLTNSGSGAMTAKEPKRPSSVGNNGRSEAANGSSGINSVQDLSRESRESHEAPVIVIAPSQGLELVKRSIGETQQQSKGNEGLISVHNGDGREGGNVRISENRVDQQDLAASGLPQSNNKQSPREMKTPNGIEEAPGPVSREDVGNDGVPAATVNDLSITQPPNPKAGIPAEKLSAPVSAVEGAADTGKQDATVEKEKTVMGKCEGGTAVEEYRATKGNASDGMEKVLGDGEVPNGPAKERTDEKRKRNDDDEPEIAQAEKLVIEPVTIESGEMSKFLAKGSDSGDELETVKGTTGVRVDGAEVTVPTSAITTGTGR